MIQGEVWFLNGQTVLLGRACYNRRGGLERTEKLGIALMKER